MGERKKPVPASIKRCREVMDGLIAVQEHAATLRLTTAEYLGCLEIHKARILEMAASHSDAAA